MRTLTRGGNAQQCAEKGLNVRGGGLGGFALDSDTDSDIDDEEFMRQMLSGERQKTWFT